LDEDTVEGDSVDFVAEGVEDAAGAVGVAGGVGAGAEDGDGLHGESSENRLGIIEGMGLIIQNAKCRMHFLKF
jgi:hypothetical protein